MNSLLKLFYFKRIKGTTVGKKERRSRIIALYQRVVIETTDSYVDGISRWLTKSSFQKTFACVGMLLRNYFPLSSHIWRESSLILSNRMWSHLLAIVWLLVTTESYRYAFGNTIMNLKNKLSSSAGWLANASICRTVLYRGMGKVAERNWSHRWDLCAYQSTQRASVCLYE